MPANRKTGEFPSPWREFLAELDGMLAEPLELHCIGGFVLTFYYGLPRTTGDIDYFTAIPANLNLDEIAGQDSPLHRKHKVWLHRTGVANLPEDYAVRLEDMAPGQLKHLNCSSLILMIAFCPNLNEPAQKTEMTRTTCSDHKNLTHAFCANDTKINCASI
jgi:hypothetical protein